MFVPPKYRQQVLFGTLLLIEVGLFVSRAALSIGMIAFIVFTCLHKDLGKQLLRGIKTPLLLGLTALFLIALITGLWSEDKQEWIAVLRIKLPLLLFPLAFAGDWELSRVKWRQLAFILLAMLFCGTIWSMSQYLQNIEAHNKDYNYARTFATPLEDDHVRFSWLVGVGLLFVIALWKEVRRNMRWLLALLFAWFVIYLHILAARTGLAVIYILLVASVLYFLFKKRSLKQTLATIVLAIVVPTMAILFLPSFRNKLNYFRYDLSYIQKNTYLPGANDGNRFLSLKAGWSLMNQHPLGIGFGDIKSSADNWLDKNVQGILPTDRLYPSSEWLVYGCGAGWLGLFLFTVIMLVPLFIKNIRYRFLWLVLNCTAAFSFLFDVGLEVQFGVFLYVFFVLWWWKWLTPERISLNNAARTVNSHNM